MYQCLAVNFSQVEKQILHAIRLIEKYGYSAEFKILGRELKEIPYRRVDKLNNQIINLGTITVEVVNYDFNMPDFKIGNYKPVAVIEHGVIDNSNNNNEICNMVHLINDFPHSLKSWWTIPGHCDDCKDSYCRKKTIILQDIETKKFRQIGTSCLKKYLGITCYNVINNYMRVTEILEDEQINIYDGLYEKENNKYVETKQYLGMALDLIKEKGAYIKDFTAKEAFIRLSQYEEQPTEEALQEATKIIDFFKNINLSDLSDNEFFMSVKAAVTATYTKCSGLVAYAPIACEKVKKELTKQETEKEIRENSSFIGDIGEKISLEVEVLKCIGIDTQYGELFINIFRQKNTSNILVWKTTTKSYIIGEELNIRATVKEHSEYQNVKQTILTRVKEI